MKGNFSLGIWVTLDGSFILTQKNQPMKDLKTAA